MAIVLMKQMIGAQIRFTRRQHFYCFDPFILHGLSLQPAVISARATPRHSI